MDLESSSSQQSQQLLPSSKVNFRCKEGIISFNNSIALLEHPNELYRHMLSFLSNCCINKALTLQPTTMYVEYLKEFWYTTEVEEETKTITFSLSWCDKPLSFTQDEFISAIGLPICKDVVPLPPKETVRAGLATLGLFDKDKPTLSSTVLVNSSPLKMKYFTPIWKLFMQYIVKCLGGMQGSHDQMNLNQQTIAYCLIWGLEIDIGAIIFSDLIHKLQNGKKNRELNICYTRFLSLIFEKLLGENYISNDLTLVKPHTITAASFQKPLASEVALTSHMLKVAKLFQEPEQSLIPPSGEVNADDTADKSLSRASVQPVTQPKAPTDLKTKKKRIPPSSKPKSPYKVRVILPKKQVTETQHAEVTVATADATQSLEASESAEEQVNQPIAAEAEKVLDQKVEETVHESGFVAMEDVTFEQIIDEFKSKTQDAEEGDAFDSLSGLRSMPDDDLASMTGFKTQDSADHVSEEGTETLHAFADKPAQSDPLGHLHEELSLLHNKLIKDSIKNSVSESIAEELPHVEAQICFTSEGAEQIPSQQNEDIHQTEGHGFPPRSSRSFKKANAEGDKWEKNSSESPAEEKDAQHPDETKGEQDSGATTVAIVQREQPSAQVIPNAGQAPLVNEEKALVLHTSEEKSSEEDTSGKKETDDEPPAKKLKFLIPSSSIPSPTPLKSIMPDPLKVTEAIKMTLDQFTKHLSKTTPSIFSPTPLREPTLPKDQTPPRDKSKGKSIATEDPLKDIMPFMEKGGSAPKISSLKSFVIPEEPLSQEKVMAQLKEMKRLAYLKAEKEKSEKFLKKILNPATIRAQTQKMAEHEAKRQKMLDEYNHQISFRADQLPITKISYVVNPNKEATMKITRGDKPLNLIVHPNFRLKTLGFSEWLESLRAKFQWVINQTRKLGLPPPPALATFGMTAEDKKRKKTEILKEVFVTKNITVDGMQRNLIPPPGVVSIEGLVINKPELGIFFMNRNTDIAFQRESEFHLTPTVQLIRIQNQIKVDSEIADAMFKKMIYVIEAMSDCIEARKIVEKNLDNLG
ncbi:hypothetical protein Tco_0838408 [Tanacetum coccineum]|uniref:Uncharacterized protein n=1 Tax=Tanacetum coccineum TaxID=301880 RepID=A0ABQ5ARL6_9ASTR